MINHLSSSQINLYLLCGLKYKYQYIDGLPKVFRTSALAFGSAFHSTLAWFHEEKMKNQDVTLEKLFLIFEADWYSQRVETGMLFKDGEKQSYLLNMGRELLTIYLQEEHKKAKGCEIPFTVPLVSPTSGKDLGIAFVGFFDLIEDDETIVEFKTSAISLTSSDVDTRIQLTAYDYAFWKLYHRRPKGIRVVDFVKSKKPKIITIETRREKTDYEGFLYTAQEVLHGIRSNVFPPRQGYWCKDCEYASICPIMKNRVSPKQVEMFQSVETVVVS